MRENEIQDVLAEALAAGGMARGTSALSRNIAVRARAASKRAEDAAQGAQEGAEAARDEARAAREQAEREAAEARRLADDAQRSAASAGANAMEAQEAARQAQAGAVAANSSATQAAKDAIEAREKADAADAKAAEAAENSAGAAEEAAQAKADAAKAAQDVSGLAQSLSSVSSQVGDMVDVQARMQADIQTTAAGLASHASSITSIQAAAGEAQEKARAAQDAAEAASGDASQALAMVGQASGAAASAQQAADKAKEDAAQAQAAADRAQADLSDAQDALAAVEAKAGANAADIARAQQAVASAKASADAAQAVADAAKSSAATAQASADGARADAEAAQKSADDAQASADAAQASADLLATRVTKCETAITQNAEAIGLMATKEEMTQRLSGYPTAAQMEAAVKVQADRIDLAVGRIDSVSSIRQVERNRADTMAQLRNYASEGHRDTWTTWKSYAGVSPGDTVQLKCDCSDTGKPVYILMAVESVTPTSATCVSHGMVDPNAELAARAYTDAKVKVESDRITAEVTERGKLGTKVATLEQTADGLSSQVSSVRSFRSFTTNYSYGQAQVNQYGTPGYQGTWAVNESTAGLKAGDTVQLRVTNASKSGHAFIVGTVVSAPSDRSVVARTTGLVDTGDRGATGASGTDLSQGRAMYADPFFSSGANGCSAYNNAGGGSVAVARQARSPDNPCSQSGHELKVTTSGAASPGHGGVYQTIQSRANAVFVRRVIAKIPAGYSLMNAENSMGSGYSCEWLTDRAGTGAFREYLYRYRCGASGTFSSGGHMYLTGGAAATASAPVVWHLACCQTYDMTGAPDSSEALAAASSLAQTVTELSTRVDQTNSSITDSIARKTTEISALQGALSGLSGDLGSVSGRVSEVEASFRRTMDAGGNPQLDLMTTANGFGTRITNTEMAFMDSGQKVAYVSNKRLYIEQAEVVGQMQVGDYAFVQRPGHLSLKYVGA